MATKTLGTNATTSLTAVQMTPGAGGILPADIATINNLILGDGTTNRGPFGGQFSYNGLLFLPRDRGVIRVLAGDWVGVDATTGWPIVVSSKAATSGPWTHS